MRLNKLVKTIARGKGRLGRGESSGRGKTAGRGMKGQKKRSKIKVGFEGGQLPIYKRLPQKRGVGNANKVTAVSITTAQLNKFPAGSKINEKTLREAGLLPKSVRNLKAKAVFNGKVEKKLEIAISASKRAKVSIEKAGGKLVNENPA